MTQMAITSPLLAPSQYLGRIIGKGIKDCLPKDSGKLYQCRLTFSNTYEYNDRTYQTNALSSNKSCKFICVIVEGKMQNRGDSIFQNAGPYFYPEKSYSLQGWVEIDWDRSKKIDVFYEVMGNVMRDPKTAIAMLLL